MKDKVKERWAILRMALREGRVAQGSSSVRNHPGFNLFSKERIAAPSTKLDIEGHTWESWDYLFKQTSEVAKLMLRQKENKISVSELLHASDNTGNICIWPSEEVLAHYCCQHLDQFRDKTICELAAGASGMAGLSIALFGKPVRMLITDGDQQAVENIDTNIQANGFASEVTAAQLLWGKTELHNDYLFDFVIAADCLFLEHFHGDLLDTLQQILKQDGIALFLAPRRGASLASFAEKAKLRGYDVVIDEEYDSHILHQHGLFISQPESKYDQDIHFPVLLKLCKGNL